MRAVVLFLLLAGSAHSQSLVLTLQKSTNSLNSWQDVPLDSSMRTVEGKLNAAALPLSGAGFYRMKLEASQTPLDMVLVTGGQLPSNSPLSGAVVSSFYLNKYEVTLDEWYKVRVFAVTNGYDLGDTGGSTSGSSPVAEDVTWYNALKWCNAKSQMEGLSPVYWTSNSVYKSGDAIPQVDTNANGYRLPSEAEWEWAARGGTKGKGYVYSGSDYSHEVAWTLGDVFNSGGLDGVRPVGTKKANELGIHDMSGNAWEWCWDVHPDTNYNDRIIRGGGTDTSGDPWGRVSYRGGNDPSLAHRDGGSMTLRPARNTAP